MLNIHCPRLFICIYKFHCICHIDRKNFMYFVINRSVAFFLYHLFFFLSIFQFLYFTFDFPCLIILHFPHHTPFVIWNYIECKIFLYPFNKNFQYLLDNNFLFFYYDLLSIQNFKKRLYTAIYSFISTYILIIKR